MKRLTSRFFYKAMGWVSDTEVRASSSDYRLLSRKALDALLCLPETHRFLRGMVNWVGFPTATVPFMPGLRGAGASKYTLRRMVGLAADGMLSFSKVPLRLSLLVGALACLLGLLVGGLTLLAALLGAPLLPGGLAAVLVVLLLLGGCILCSLGVVGEYVGRVYEEVKGRPLYLLKEAVPPDGKQEGRGRPSRPQFPRDASAA